MLRHRAGVALALAALSLGCRHQELPAVAAQAGPPPMTTSVGPTPGLASEHPPQRNPFGDDPAAPVAGRRLFVQMNCSGCHGGRAGGGMGPSLRDVDWLFGQSDAQIFSSIAEGRAHGMPAWGTRLPSDEIWKLVAYVKSLRTAHEPNPPGE